MVPKVREAEVGLRVLRSSPAGVVATVEDYRYRAGGTASRLLPLLVDAWNSHDQTARVTR